VFPRVTAASVRGAKSIAAGTGKLNIIERLRSRTVRELPAADAGTAAGSARGGGPFTTNPPVFRLIASFIGPGSALH
jgi:hypothetical protein